jgi:CheY-like chemotaxis protein/signal transduction histidine kinase/HPt (histidine-containing phosphotransfer) domain-containing protein
MEQESAEALRAELGTVLAERDRLRLALAEAGGVIERLRTDAQAGSQAKADFMARMTHEMRTPLSAIIGLANLALPLVADPKLTDYVAKIMASARGLLEVVDDITDFSRLEKGQADLTAAPFALAAAFSRVRDRLELAARLKGLALEVHLDPAIPARLVGDSPRLEGILGHLAGNAVKFTERGAVRLEARLVAREDGLAEVAFCVVDSGIGMDEAAIPAMLDSFTQGDGSLSRPYGGTGLGLALASRGVALLGGSLAVESRPGLGTRFHFAVRFAADAADAADLQAAGQVADPLSVAPAAALAVAADGSLEDRPLSGTLVLLVEDNAINQQVARETLEHLGAAVDVAQNGREAVEMVRAAFYDVVLMDVQMPVMDGLAAARAIRAFPGMAELPIVALTAHALAEDRDRCLEAGMNDYLTKPLDVTCLLAALGQWIAPAAAAATARRIAVAAGDKRHPGIGPAGPGRPAGQPAGGIDAATALTRLGGNGRLLASVAAEFARDYAASPALLAGYLARGESDAARRLVHTIKGVAGNLAANALAGAARVLETDLTAGRRPEAAALEAFTRTLDEAVASAASLVLPSTSEPACTGTGCWRVLLVDDAKLNRAIFSQILRTAGHEVVTADNGKEACRVLFGEKSSKRPFDLILMDIEMPEMDGPTAARTIRRLLAASVAPPCPPGVPIVALTSHDADAERPRCLEAGMDACLHKVFEQGELLATLSGIMGSREGKARQSACPRPAGGAGPGLLPLLRCMAGHLAEGSIRADEDMAVVREAFVGCVTPPEVAELSEAIERYEFARAVEILRRLALALGLEVGAVVPEKRA